MKIPRLGTFIIRDNFEEQLGSMKTQFDTAIGQQTDKLKAYTNQLKKAEANTKRLEGTFLVLKDTMPQTLKEAMLDKLTGVLDTLITKQTKTISQDILLQRDRDLPEKFKSTLQNALKQPKKNFSAIVQNILQQQNLKLEETFKQQSDQLLNRLNNPATVLDSLRSIKTPFSRFLLHKARPHSQVKTAILPSAEPRTVTSESMSFYCPVLHGSTFVLSAVLMIT